MFSEMGKIDISIFKLNRIFVLLTLVSSCFSAVPLFAETFGIASEDRFVYPRLQDMGFVDVRANDEVRRSDAFSRLPAVYAGAFDVLYRGDLAKAGPLVERVDDLLFRANHAEAARMLGSVFNQRYDGSRIVLGELARTLQPLAGDLEEFAFFMSNFLKGYPNNEVLFFTTEGLDRHASYSPGRPFLWGEAPYDTEEVDMLDRVFSTEDAAMIPFFAVEKFEVDLWGSDVENARGELVEVALWKVKAGHIVKEVWDGGRWHRNVLVLGDKIR